CALVPASSPAQPARSQSSSSPEPEQASSGSQTQAPPAASDSNAAPSAKADAAKSKKPKKVWTEDDMGKLDGKVNVVGDAQAPSRGGSSASAGGGDASTYRNKLAPLRQKLENIEAQIRDLQNAKLGGRENISWKIEKLGSQKKDVQAQIDAIEEEAR